MDMGEEWQVCVSKLVCFLDSLVKHNQCSESTLINYRIMFQGLLNVNFAQQSLKTRSKICSSNFRVCSPSSWCSCHLSVPPACTNCDMGRRKLPRPMLPLLPIITMFQTGYSKLLLSSLASRNCDDDDDGMFGALECQLSHWNVELPKCKWKDSRGADVLVQATDGGSDRAR